MGGCGGKVAPETKRPDKLAAKLAEGSVLRGLGSSAARPQDGQAAGRPGCQAVDFSSVSSK